MTQREKIRLEVDRLHRKAEAIKKGLKADTILDTSVSLQAREQECTSEERITSVLLLIDQT